MTELEKAAQEWIRQQPNRETTVQQALTDAFVAGASYAKGNGMNLAELKPGDEWRLQYRDGRAVWVFSRRDAGPANSGE